MFVKFQQILTQFWENCEKKAKTQNSFINQMLHFIKYTNLGNAAAVGGGGQLRGKGKKAKCPPTPPLYIHVAHHVQS